MQHREDADTCRVDASSLDADCSAIAVDDPQLDVFDGTVFVRRLFDNLDFFDPALRGMTVQL